jgi:dUTP pyrophosphatase
MKIKFLKLSAEAILPAYAHTGDAGMDICSIEDKELLSGCSALIKTGLKMQLPKNTEAQVRPRSGLALKHCVTLLNSPGTIDQNYRGEICVILINHGKSPFKVEKGMRIAQLIIQRVLCPKITEADILSDTNRQDKGFGSSGLK